MGLTSALGQFTIASVTQHQAGTTSAPSKTGNDILDDGSNIYRVSTYDAGYPYVPGISFCVHYSGLDYNNFGVQLTLTGTDFYFSDVCLVKDIGDNTIHALVAYYVTSFYGGGWEIEDFVWYPSIHTFGGNGVTFIDGGYPGTDVNIDADDDGNFVVVYDDAGNNINYFSGSVNNALTYGLSINNSGSPVSGHAFGTYPDLSILRNAYGSYVYETHIDQGYYFGNLIVNKVAFSDIVNNSVSNTLICNITPHYTNYPSNFSFFGHPRIACPNYAGNGSSYDWSVIVDEVDYGRAKYDIEGYNVNVSTSAPIYYNSAYTTDISSAINFNPVVTYDIYGNVWAGWNFDNSAPTITTCSPPQAIFPIVMECDYTGTTLSYYLEVPNSIGTSDNINALSLASRNSSELFLTYHYFSPSVGLYTKWLPSVATVSHLKTINHCSSLSMIGSFDLFSSINTTSLLTLNLYNTTGQLVLQDSGDANKIRNTLKQNSDKLPLSIYIAKIISDDGAVNLSGKFLLGE